MEHGKLEYSKPTVCENAKISWTGIIIIIKTLFVVFVWWVACECLNMTLAKI